MKNSTKTAIKNALKTAIKEHGVEILDLVEHMFDEKSAPVAQEPRTEAAAKVDAQAPRVDVKKAKYAKLRHIARGTSVKEETKNFVSREAYTEAPSWNELEIPPEKKKEASREEVFEAGFATGVAELGVSLLASWALGKGFRWFERKIKEEVGVRS